MFSQRLEVLTVSDAFEYYPEAFDFYTDDISNIDLLYVLETKDNRGGDRLYIIGLKNGDLMNAGTGELYDSLLDVIKDYFDLRSRFDLML